MKTLGLLVALLGVQLAPSAAEDISIFEDRGAILDISQPPPADLLGKSVSQAVEAKIASIVKGTIDHPVLFGILRDSRIIGLDAETKLGVQALLPGIEHAVQVNLGNPGAIHAALFLFPANKVGIVMLPDGTLAMHDYVFVW